LNCLAASIPGRERVITCEEVFELRLPLPDVVAMQTRQPNLEGTGEIRLRRLVKEALRMRPDRIIVGEVRQEECLDLLALAITAGEGPVGALERVTRISSGELTRELSRALAEARSGASLVQALEGIARRTSLAPLARFVDGVAVAVERGTPLAEVMRAQAVDVREAGKRQLLESAGRREIAMMVPVVFLVLPVTVILTTFSKRPVLEAA
jgi:Flp pilus assembly protein TadB